MRLERVLVNTYPLRDTLIRFRRAGRPREPRDRVGWRRHGFHLPRLAEHPCEGRQDLRVRLACPLLFVYENEDCFWRLQRTALRVGVAHFWLSQAVLDSSR